MRRRSSTVSCLFCRSTICADTMLRFHSLGYAFCRMQRRYLCCSSLEFADSCNLSLSLSLSAEQRIKLKKQTTCKAKESFSSPPILISYSVEPSTNHKQPNAPALSPSWQPVVCRPVLLFGSSHTPPCVITVQKRTNWKPPGASLLGAVPKSGLSSPTNQMEYCVPCRTAD